MRKSPVVVLACLVVVIATAGLWTATKPRQPVYTNRAAAPTSLLAPFDGKRLLIPGEVLQSHEQFSEHVLLIRDTSVVESAAFESDPDHTTLNSPWSFSGVLQAGFRQRKDDVQRFINDWTNSLKGAAGEVFRDEWGRHDAGFSIDRAPVRLLAVVNRLDLARVEDGTCNQPPGQPCLCGAEIRFVFGAVIPKNLRVRPDGYFSMIVEFVLPCQSQAAFQVLVRSWRSLNVPGWPQKYHTDLGERLREATGAAELVRLRTIMSTFNNSWNVQQYKFTPQGLVRKPLDREFKPAFYCLGPESDIGTFAKQRPEEILAGRYDVDDKLGTSVTTVTVGAHPVLTLARNLQPGDNTDKVRFSLSINSCTGCHSGETETSFHHVAMRKRNERSRLSCFLTGSTTSEPSATQFCSVNAPEHECNSQPTVRDFNDLLRRHLFLDAVDHLDVNAPAAEWKKALDGVNAVQTH